MPPPNRTINGDPRAFDEFINDLEATSDQVKKLLDVVRTSEFDLIALKTELRILCESVKDLSSILRGGNGNQSLLTKISLIEQKIVDIEKNIEDKDKDVKTTQQSLADIVVADKTGSWKMKTAVGTAIVGGVVSIITFLAEILK